MHGPGLTPPARLSERDEAVSGLTGLALGPGPAIALVSGPVGCGRTELLAAVAHRVRDAGGLVLEATGTSPARPLLAELFHPAVLPAAERANGEALARSPAVDTARTRHLLASLVQRLCVRSPVVLCIDDAGLADPASLRHLAELPARLRSAHLTLLVADRPAPDPAVDLSRAPGLWRIRVGPLSASGVAQLLAGTAAAPFSTEFHRASGGNPLLVRALLDDLADGPSPGPSFGRAVLGCLRRYGPDALAIARGSAVLGQDATTGLLAALLDRAPEALSSTMDTLASAGLLDGTGLRAPAAASAVLADLPAADRSAWHSRAAGLLRSRSYPAASVARQLIAAGRPEPDAVDTLLTAARTAEPACAAAGLDLAARSCEESRRGPVVAALAEVEARTDPATAARHTEDLLAASARGALSEAANARLARRLLWHGRHDDVRDVLPRLAPRDPARPAAAFTFPGRFTARHDPGSAESLLLATLGGATHCAPMADRFLCRARLDDTTAEPLAYALETLIAAGEPDRAEPHCERLAEEAGRRHAPAWQAVYGSVRSEIARRTGNAAAALHHIETALGLLPLPAWGIGGGTVLSRRILALLDLGRVAEAEAALAEDVLTPTPHSLRCQYARGRVLLATGHAQAALGEFRHGRETARRWGMDRPGFLHWADGIAAARAAEAPAVSWAALSAAEQRVAEATVSGRTNQEIAGRLHLTVSTVEQHLTRVYRKLGVRGRRELAATSLARSTASPAGGETGRAG